MSFYLPAAEAQQDPRAVLAELIGADYSARALSVQRSDTAPDVVRAALERFKPNDARSSIDIEGLYCVADRGNAGAIRSATWEEAFASIGEHAEAAYADAYPAERFVVTLGGDHSISWPVIDAAARVVRRTRGPSARIGVLQLDVHHDVRSMEHGPSNGTPFRGLLENGVISPDDLVQIGIHPFGNARELTQYCDEQGIRRFLLDEVEELGAEGTVRAALRELTDVDAIYLSVDIDVLDRSHAPGTAAALPGGLDPRTLVQIVELACADPRVIGMDVVEFDPERDVASLTAYAAANAIIAALAAVARRLGSPT